MHLTESRLVSSSDKVRMNFPIHLPKYGILTSLA
jgi:hypothetical protein